MSNVLINVRISRKGSTSEPNGWPQRVSFIGGDTTHAPWWTDLVRAHKLILSQWPPEILPFDALGLPFPVAVPTGAVHYSYQGPLHRLDTGLLVWKDGTWTRNTVSTRTCETCHRPGWVTTDVHVISGEST